MQQHSNAWKKAGLSALFGLGIAAVTMAPVLADRSYRRCDQDRCYRVVCDDDGDHCRQVYDPTSYYRRDNDRDRHDQGYDRDRHRRWSCGEDGNHCHWVYDRGDNGDQDDDQ
jgi:hypothetical protein